MTNKSTQLFLLHFAGGSSYSYEFLKQHIKQTVEFIPLELPGRGNRFNEQLIKNKPEAIEDYVNQIKQLRKNRPYLIYGHSMGATLGFSVANRMELNNDPPEILIVSGNAGPEIRNKEKPKRYLLNDTEFRKVLSEFGGLPKGFLEDDELYDFFNPIMRADFELLEEDDFSEKDTKLKIPIYALMGTEEEKNGQIENWKNFTENNFEYKRLKGKHFFIYEHPAELAKLIHTFSNSLLHQTK